MRIGSKRSRYRNLRFIKSLYDSIVLDPQYSLTGARRGKSPNVSIRVFGNRGDDAQRLAVTSRNASKLAALMIFKGSDRPLPRSGPGDPGKAR